MYIYVLISNTLQHRMLYNFGIYERSNMSLSKTDTSNKINVLWSRSWAHSLTLFVRSCDPSFLCA